MSVRELVSQQQGDAPCDANVGVAALAYLDQLLPPGTRAGAWWTVLDECRYWGDTELEDFLLTARMVASAHRVVTEEDHRRARRAALDAIEHDEDPGDGVIEAATDDADAPSHEEQPHEEQGVDPTVEGVAPGVETEPPPKVERKLLSYVLVALGVVAVAAAMIGFATAEEPVPPPESVEAPLDADRGSDEPGVAVGTSGAEPSRSMAAREASTDPGDVAAPVTISIDAIDVRHPVVPVGLQPNGEMEVPDDVDEIGWYEPGVKPGELGSAVLAGHVDSSAQGPGAFYDLRHLEEGDVITVADADGTERSWEVTRLVRYPKDEIPLEDLFRWEGDEAGLVLVTCGGEFDRTARSYVDNIVVYTTPLGG